jgi:hypothetical protein
MRPNCEYGGRRARISIQQGDVKEAQTLAVAMEGWNRQHRGGGDPDYRRGPRKERARSAIARRDAA